MHNRSSTSQLPAPGPDRGIRAWMFCIAFEDPPTNIGPVSMAAYAEDAIRIVMFLP